MCLQKCNINNASVLQISIPVPILSCDLLCEFNSDMWQQHELVSGFDSELQDSVGWSRQWFVSFNAEKCQFFSFDF